jgi:hypothetical protein
MHEMNDIGDRHQYHPGPVIGAGPFCPLSRLRFLAELGSSLVLVNIALGCIVIIWSGHIQLRLSVKFVATGRLATGVPRGNILLLWEFLLQKWYCSKKKRMRLPLF